MQRGTYIWIVLLSALALIAVTGAGAGDPAMLWNNTYGGPDAGEAAYAIVPDPGGAGFFLAGETASFGKTDAWVIRLTPEGGEEWNRTYGGGEAETARSIIRTDEGNLLFAGSLTLVTNGTEAETDAWIVMIDPSGMEVWNRTYGGPDVNASANAVTGTDDGGYLFVGSIALRGGNESDAWVVRLNGTGMEVWSRLLGGTGNETANAVTRLPGGDFVVAGSTESSGAGMADLWVVRLNESGGEVWNRTFGSPDDDAARAVINTSDGNLLVAGTFTERPDNATVDTDALLIKLTLDGETVWNWIYGDFGVNESADAVIETADGSYLFAGETGFPGVDDTDAWLVATDAGGAVAWSRTFGGVHPGDRAASVLEIEPGEYVFAGTFNATENGGPVNTDAWAVRLGTPPEPTPTPTATPTPGPTATPIKPPKAPVVPQKTPVTPVTTPVKTPTPEPTRTGEPTGTPTPGPNETTEPTGTLTATPTTEPNETVMPTGTQTPGPNETTEPTGTSTETLTPTPTTEPNETVMPTETPGGDLNDTGNSSSLSGTVWYDLNADGVLDPGEPGIPGIGVRLIGKRTMFDHAVTGPDGSYRFETIPAGGYSGVEFLLPDGYSCTVSGRGSDADPLEGGVAFAEGGAGRQTLNAGFTGNHHPGTPAAAYGWILGTTWSDDNQDGVRDETSGITDVEARLLDAGGNQVASARTGHHDHYTSLYLFGPLLPGEYSLAFTAPDGYAFTTSGGGSHADPVTGTTVPFSVGGGDTVVRDAGLIPAPIPTQTRTAPPAPAGERDDDGAGSTEDGADDEQDNATGDDDRERPVVTPPAPQNPGSETGEDERDDSEDGAGREQGDSRDTTAGGTKEDGDDEDEMDDARSGADREQGDSRDAAAGGVREDGDDEDDEDGSGEEEDADQEPGTRAAGDERGDAADDDADERKEATRDKPDRGEDDDRDD